MTSRALLAVLSVAVAGGIAAVPGAASASTLSQSTCHLAGPYKHVIFIQYDNTHLSRDNPNVPSDLEQIPALKDFLTSNGTLDSSEHTPLISHTADDIVTTESGLYPDRQGLGVSNSYAQYAPGSGAPPTSFPSAFTYWTDPVSSTDTLPNLITTGKKNAPAPWVAYTRAGCDVGAFSIADIELENTGTGPSGDITSVYGSGSPQWNFAKGAASSSLKQADFEGIAVHCSQADSVNGSGHAGICSPQNGGVADKLPNEPGGYSGYNGLFGSIYSNQVTSSPGSFVSSTADANGTAAGVNDLAPPVHDVFGYSFSGCQYCAGGPQGPSSSQVITDNSGDSGFPSGFDPLPSQTLGYVASMQEAGIPVTFAYIEDAHNEWTPPYDAMGPGQSEYTNQLKQENQAYEAFFERLQADGINKSNTLFVFTADEGDYFAGGKPTNPGCDGVTVPCTYAPNTVGEQDVSMNDLLARERNDTHPFEIHYDDNPNFYVGGAPGSTSPPGPNDPAVRELEQDVGKLTLKNQITGATNAATDHVADAEDQLILHMDSNDPLRTPSFTDFGNPYYYFEGGSCPASSTPGCPTVYTGDAWNHGGDEPVVDTTWLGVVGPTVKHLGQTGGLWTDHTDTRPTMLAILGLKSDYQQDGSATTQMIDPSQLPASVQANLGTYQALQNAYAQLNAPVGKFGRASERVSTLASESESSGDSTYKEFNKQLAACQAARAPVVAQMKADLNNAIFANAAVNPTEWSQLTLQADTLVNDMEFLSQQQTPPSFTVCS